LGFVALAAGAGAGAGASLAGALARRGALAVARAGLRIIAWWSSTRK
jgi:predicted ATPase